MGMQVYVVGESLASRGMLLLLGTAPYSLSVRQVPEPDEVARHLAGPERRVVVICLSAHPEALAAVAQCLEAAAEQPGVLVITSAQTPAATLLAYVRPGWGFVHCGSSVEVLQRGIEAVAAGRWFADPVMGDALIAALAQRQHEHARASPNPGHRAPGMPRRRCAIN
jgi:DNA-binding NarL/FixJ family response regulator